MTYLEIKSELIEEIIRLLNFDTGLAKVTRKARANDSLEELEYFKNRIIKTNKEAAELWQRMPPRLKQKMSEFKKMKS